MNLINNTIKNNQIKFKLKYFLNKNEKEDDLRIKKEGVFTFKN